MPPLLAKKLLQRRRRIKCEMMGAIDKQQEMVAAAWCTTKHVTVIKDPCNNQKALIEREPPHTSTTRTTAMPSTTFLTYKKQNDKVFRIECKAAAVLHLRTLEQRLKLSLDFFQKKTTNIKAIEARLVLLRQERAAHDMAYKKLVALIGNQSQEICNTIIDSDEARRQRDGAAVQFWEAKRDLNNWRRAFQKNNKTSPSTASSSSSSVRPPSKRPRFERSGVGSGRKHSPIQFSSESSCSS